MRDVPGRLLSALAVALGLLALAAPLFGQGEKGPPKKIRFAAALRDPFSQVNQAAAANGEAGGARRGEVIHLAIDGEPDQGWYTYPVSKLAPGQSSAQLAKVEILSPEFAPAGDPVEVTQPQLSKGELKYFGPFTWTMPVLVRPSARAGQPATLRLRISAQACKETCIPAEYELTVPVSVSGAASLPISDEQQKAIKEHDAFLATLARKAPGGPAAPGEFNGRDKEVVDVESGLGIAGKNSGLLAVIATAIIGGLISLVTPCVFPMIPITVSFFLKQSETAGGKRALLMATVYSGTLVLVLTVGGVILGSVLQRVAQHWATNLFLTAVFVFFGLSLLGMYEIQLPSSLADLTSSREGKGGLMGIVFMALTFSIISFACVGPIYGGFTALSATSPSAIEGWTARIAGPLAFSIAFASPFFVLALFPQLLKKMPRSGTWMNTVKVVMGFLELAAAFKFVRAAELNLLAGSEYFTFDLVMGIYVALAVACGLYLFNVYRLPHDYTAVETISVPRLVTGLVFLSLALYFLPGLFKDDKGRSQKPRGTVYEWTRSFLLPDDPSEWSADLAEALARAERENKPLFIDFTGLG